MTVLPESKIFGPVNQQIHSDDWPIHHLRKVNVISQQTGQCVSLLESHKDHAVQVTGVLADIDPSTSQKLVLDRRWRSHRIELNNVSFWAFSQELDGSVSLWASGTAGWFELHDPVPQYRDIFDGMNEAVSMLYYLADKWRRSRKGHMQMKVKEVNRHVQSAFRDSHARFLITSMLEGQDNQDWHQSPFLRYFQIYFQDIYDEAESRLYPPRQVKQAKAKDSIKPATTRQRKEPLARARADQSYNMNTHRTRRHVRDELPRTPHRSNGHTDETDTSGDEEYDANGKVVKAGTKRKSKSILQPKGSKFSKKTASRRQSLPAITSEKEEGNTDSDEKDELPEPSPLAAMAPRESLYPHYLPRKFTEVNMISYDIPSDKPQGPGDLWTCAFENCDQRVHEASKPKGKARIKEHFQLHARQAQEKIDLALSESRPYLPVT
ncbi:MAG: hypothetical protein LQ343_008009 [Gyalolechia ehrenbergii]|nr:MAG: hypothetical protein LQ343_008009 [Gyalolechia ehrenbergii]